MVALYSPLVFSTPVPSPLSVGLSLPRSLHQEKTPTITRFVAFFSFPFYLFLFSSLFSALLLSLSFFFYSFPLRISPVSLYIRLQTKFYVYFIRTYTRSTPFVYTCTFVRPDVRIVINTTLASPYNARRFCVSARSLLAYVSSLRLCSAGAIDQVCLAECTRSYCFHSLSFFPPQPPPRFEFVSGSPCALTLPHGFFLHFFLEIRAHLRSDRS